MGKPTGFLEYQREDAPAFSVSERIRHFNEFHEPLSEAEQKKQAARCMACGVPFCQSGMMIGGMISGCPLGNLIPEWNDLLYRGAWKQAYDRLRLTNSFPEFTSRVCPALCEKACTCGAEGDAVTVRANEYARRWPLSAPAPPDLRQRTDSITGATASPSLREATASAVC